MKSKLFIMILMLIFSISAFAEYSDMRYRRDQNGMELSVPAKAMKGERFPISLNSGTRTITRLAILNQGGYWNQYFPASHQAEDIGLTMYGVDATHSYVSEFDYHRWELSNYTEKGTTQFEIIANQQGRIALYVWLKRNDGVESQEIFVVDISSSGTSMNVDSSGTSKATIASNLNIQIPSATYSPILGDPMDLWVDLQFVPSTDGSLMWQLSNYGLNQ